MTVYVVVGQARAKRRYVLGLREVTKHLRLKRIKCVIASPNMERIQSTGKNCCLFAKIFTLSKLN